MIDISTSLIRLEQLTTAPPGRNHLVFGVTFHRSSKLQTQLGYQTGYLGVSQVIKRSTQESRTATANHLPNSPVVHPSSELSASKKSSMKTQIFHLWFLGFPLFIWVFTKSWLVLENLNTRNHSGIPWRSWGFPVLKIFPETNPWKSSRLTQLEVSRNGATPSYHPNFNRIFHYKPPILEVAPY